MNDDKKWHRKYNKECAALYASAAGIICLIFLAMSVFVYATAKIAVPNTPVIPALTTIGTVGLITIIIPCLVVAAIFYERSRKP